MAQARVIDLTPSPRLLRLPQVLEIVPVARSTWWGWVAARRAPQPIKLSARCTVWREGDIFAFVEARAGELSQ